MGGTTITVYGNTEEKVLAEMKKQILAGVESELYPDSAAVLIKGDDMIGDRAKKSKAKLFNVTNEGEFTETEKGRTFHVSMAARFSRVPEHGEILGTVHLHT